MDGRLLRMSEEAQLTRLRDHGRIRGDLLFGRRAQLGGDVCHDQGYVIEELLRRKDVVELDRQEFVQTIEPLPGKGEAFRSHALRDNASVAVGGRYGGMRRQGKIIPPTMDGALTTVRPDESHVVSR